MRDPTLQSFIDALGAAFAVRTEPSTPLAELSGKIFGAAADASEWRKSAERRTTSAPPVLPHLAPALITAATGSPQTSAVANSLSALAPHLIWRQRPPGVMDPVGFADDHANATLIGADGIEPNERIRVGASLVAPETRYPDHDHPPEEMYLSLSPDSQWRNDSTDWHTPGIGGLVHNPPGIGHAMRAGRQPLLAIWCLWLG